MDKEAFHNQLYGNEQLYSIDRSVIKNTLVVLHHNGEGLTESSKILLGKILSAIDKSLESATLINTAESEVDFDKFLGCTILLFGVASEKVNQYPSQLYQFEKINENRVLASDSLTKLGGDTSLKTSLWNALKLLKS